MTAIAIYVCVAHLLLGNLLQMYYVEVAHKKKYKTMALAAIQSTFLISRVPWEFHIPTTMEVEGITRPACFEL